MKGGTRIKQEKAARQETDVKGYSWKDQSNATPGMSSLPRLFSDISKSMTAPEMDKPSSFYSLFSFFLLFLLKSQA